MSEQACRTSGLDPDAWFAWPGSARANAAKQVCMTCPLYWECAEYALAEGIPDGIWGGLDERERARIWKKRGGKPTKFLDDIDAAIGPLLQYRRDFENATPEAS